MVETYDTGCLRHEEIDDILVQPKMSWSSTLQRWKQQVPQMRWYPPEKPTLCHNPEDQNLNFHSPENLKS
jgi:hypothetical protein